MHTVGDYFFIDGKTITFVQVFEWSFFQKFKLKYDSSVPTLPNSVKLKVHRYFFLHYLLHWSALQSNEVVLFRNHLPLFGEKYFMTEQMLQSKSLYMSHSVSNLYFLMHM